MIEFKTFPKIPRLKREMVITEKIDGTNAQVFITTTPADYVDEALIHKWQTDDAKTWGMWAGSRTRWITPKDDNYGFAKWVETNAEFLKDLGPGSHFGEWWGEGIQRRYGIVGKKFSLFNVKRWGEIRPACCDVVPVLYRGEFSLAEIQIELHNLRILGSAASPGFMRPEGVVVYHLASGQMFKMTIEGDNKPKGEPNA